MADSLKIDIDVAAAQASLNELKTSFGGLSTAISNFGKNSSAAISRFADSMSKLQGIDPNTIASVTRLSEQLNGIQTGKVGELANELRRLGNVDVSKVSSNLQQLQTTLKDIRTPPDLNQMAQNFSQVANAANQAAAAVRNKATAANATQAAVKGLGTELINAAGYMAGLGVSAGQLVQHFNKLRSENMSLGDMFKAVSENLGTWGSLAAGVGAVGIALAAVSAAVTSLIQPVIQAQTQIDAFRNTIDSLRGAGEGEKAFAELSAMAKRTGQDLRTMTEQFMKFDAVAAQSGLTADKSRQIFEGFSIAFTAVGASAEKTSRGFMAIQQMLSKTTVMSEELKQQLAEALPGAMQAFAKAAGVSAKGLEDLLKSGQLIAAEILPKVADILSRDYKLGLAQALQQSAAAIKAFSSAWFELLGALGRGNLGGIAAGFTAGLNTISEALSSPIFKDFARVIGDLVGVLTGAALGAIGGFAQAVALLASPITTAVQAIFELGTALGVFHQSAASAATSIGGLSAIIAAGVASVTTYFAVLKGLPVVLGLVSTAAGGLAAALGVAATAMAGFAMGTITAIIGSLREFASASWAAVKAIAALSFTQLVSGFQTAASAVMGFAAAIRALTWAQFIASTQQFIATLGTLASTIKAVTFAQFTAGLAALPSLFASVTSAITAFTTALLAIPMVRVIAALTALGAGAVVLYNHFTRAAEGASRFADGLSATSTPAEVAAQSVKKFLDGVKQTPGDLAAAAGAMNSYDELMKRSARTVKELGFELKEQQADLKAFQAGMAATERAHDGFVAGIQASKAALEEQKERLQRSMQDMKGYGGSANDAGSASDMLAGRIQRLSRAIKDEETAIASANRANDDRKRRDQEFAASAAELIAKKQQEIAVLKEYGIALNQQQQDEVQSLQNMGLKKEQAVSLVASLQNLMQTEQQRAQGLQAEADAQLKQAEWAKGQITALQELLKAKEADWQADKRSKEEIEGMRRQYTGMIATLMGLQDQSLQAALKNGTLAQSFRDGVPVMKAAEDQAKMVSERFGTDYKTALETASGALDNLKSKQDGTNASTQNFANNGKSAWERIKAAAEGFAKWFAGDSMSTTNAKLKETSAAFQRLQETSTTVQEPIKVVASAFNEMAGSLPVVAQALIQTVQPLPGFVESMTQLAGVVPALSGPFQIIGQAFGAIGAGLTLAGPLLPPFVEGLRTLSTLGDGLNAVTAAFNGLVASLSNAAGQMEAAATNASSLSGALSSLAGGFGAATTSGQEMLGILQQIIEECRTAISVMSALEAAAIAAFEAAKRANDEASRGGGGGGQSGRYGGISGNLPETVPIRPGTFDNAPQFKEGTANTSSYLSKVPGGGIPSILHPNEAVVPLGKGNKIPVDLSGVTISVNSPQENVSTAMETMLSDLGKMADSQMLMARRMAESYVAPSQSLERAVDNLGDTLERTKASRVPRYDRSGTDSQENDAPFKMPKQAEFDWALARNDAEMSRARTGPSPNSEDSTKRTPPTIVNVHINANSLDTVQRTQDQLAVKMGKTIDRAMKRRG